MCFYHMYQFFYGLSMVIVHFSILHIVKIYPVFLAIHLKVNSCEH